MLSYVDVRDISFAYGRRTILHEVSLHVDKGMTGLVGPNGAGKTTLLSILSTLRKPQGGSLTVCGINPYESHTALQEARRYLGVLPQKFHLVSRMTVRDTLRYAAWVHEIPAPDIDAAVERVSDLVSLNEIMTKRVGKLSGGQHQRVGIATAIIHKPALLLLDEPTVGLDPEIRVELRGVLKKIAQETAVFMSTHLIEDVALTCDKIVVLSDGKVKFEGSPDILVSSSNKGDDSVGQFGSHLELAYMEALKR